MIGSPAAPAPYPPADAPSPSLDDAQECPTGVLQAQINSVSIGAPIDPPPKGIVSTYETRPVKMMGSVTNATSHPVALSLVTDVVLSGIDTRGEEVQPFYANTPMSHLREPSAPSTWSWSQGTQPRSPTRMTRPSNPHDGER